MREYVMSCKPIFSILVTNYNNRAYAGEMIDSLLSQTFPDWEAVIVDDHSSDGGIADIVASRHDDRLVYIQMDRNSGYGHTCNRCVDHSRGDLLVTLDSDDALMPNYLEKVHKCFSSNDCILVYTDLQLFGLSNKIIELPQKTVEDLADAQWLPHPGCCITRLAMLKSGGYYEGAELRHGNVDWDWFLSIAENCEFKATRIPEALVRYRVHSAQMSAKRVPWEYETRCCIYRRHKAFFDALGKGASFLAEGYFTSAGARWREGDYQQAVELAAKGVACAPPQEDDLPKLQENIATLARKAILLEKELTEISGRQVLHYDNITKRIYAVAAFAALKQWDVAERLLLVGMVEALRYGVPALVGYLASRLALVHHMMGDTARALEDAEMALQCNPGEACLPTCFHRYVEEGRRDKALLLFAPFLEENIDAAALRQVAPFFALLADLPGMDTAKVAERLRMLPQSRSEPLPARLYRYPLGRKLYWEMRAKDLYEKWGSSNGSHAALCEVVKRTNARTVLEVGCGNGRNLELLARLGLKCVGQDISESALEIARKRNLPHTTLHCAPLSELEFSDRAFDMVVCVRVLQHVAEVELPGVLDVIARLGRYLYVDESLPEDIYGECFYLKKYDLVHMLQIRGLRLLCELHDIDAPHALLFENCG